MALLLALAILVVSSGSNYLLAGRFLRGSLWLSLISRGVSGVSGGWSCAIGSGSQSVVNSTAVSAARRNVLVNLGVRRQVRCHGQLGCPRQADRLALAI